MLYLLSDATDFVYRYVDGGVSPDSQIVIDRINEACRLLINKGNWKKTVRRMRFYTQQNTISMPYGAKRILKVDIDKIPRKIFSPYYEYLEFGPGEVDCCNDVWSRNLQLYSSGNPVQFDPPTDSARKIFAVSTEVEDTELSLTVNGFLQHNNEMRTGYTPGESLQIGRWDRGVEGQLNSASFPTLSDGQYLEIISVKKPITKGYVCLYTYDESTKQMWFLGKYHPNETNPDYVRYRILGATLPMTALDRTGNYYQNVLCMVKLDAVPMVHENDVLPIQNLDAIKTMIQSIEFRNSGDSTNADKYEATAIRFLNEELKDYQTNDGIHIEVDSHHRIGTSPNIV